MAKALTVSPTMQAAIDHAKEHGGCLVRYPGGFWCRQGLMDYSHPWWGTPTVQALVSRGLATYTEWHEGRHNTFPIRAALASASPQPTAQEPQK